MIARQGEATDAPIARAPAAGEAAVEAVRRLETPAGAKDLTARTPVALLPELGRLDRRAIAAPVGRAPFDRDGGQTRGVRAVGGGRAPVRAALHMAARAAARRKAPLGEFYRGPTARGKAAKVATVALVRKMVLALNAMLRDGQGWKHATPRRTARIPETASA